MSQTLKNFMTGSNEVFFPGQNDYSNWKKDVSNYTQTKKEFQGKAEPPVYFKEKEYKQIESQYNPITQKYNNSNSETLARTSEHENFINTLAKNKDTALRYEQTYNVINF